MPTASLSPRAKMPRFWSRFTDRVEAWTAAPTPPVAVEFAAGRAVAGRLGANGVQIVSRPLSADLVAPSAVHANLGDPAEITSVLRSLFDSMGGIEAAVTLLVPDLTARISILDFDVLPSRRDELAPLARFRLRKSLPFPEEQAVISCQPLSPARLLVAVADRARLDEYENCLEAAGAHAAIVLPSGLACLAAEPRLDHDVLLIRAETGSLTTAFCRDGKAAFFRVVELTTRADFEDVYPSIAFFRERGETGASEAGGSGREPALFAAGLGAELERQLREQIPDLPLRVAGAPTQLAVTGALRGNFA